MFDQHHKNRKNAANSISPIDGREKLTSFISTPSLNDASFTAAKEAGIEPLALKRACLVRGQALKSSCEARPGSLKKPPSKVKDCEKLTGGHG